MRAVDEGLQAHLDTGATTTCTCWILTRKDGVQHGFTDHDRKLFIGGVVCEPTSGMRSTEAVSVLGLATDNQEVEGALTSEVISEDAINAGAFDGARVSIWLVNWQSPEQRLQLRTTTIGEIARQDGYFRAELRGLSSLLSQKSGRRYLRSCDARLGDQRCGVDLADPAFHTSCTVVEVIDRRLLRVTGMEGFEQNHFANGLLHWVTGANAGRSVELTTDQPAKSDEIALLIAPPSVPDIGDTFELRAGCDRTFQMCKSKFANHLNFRGFPHMPGSDFALSYADGDTVHDGSVLVP